MNLAEMLTPALCFAKIEGRSQKRVFEVLSKKISDRHFNLSYSDIFDALSAREKLGSTGVGDGVAIPHCRLEHEGPSIAAIATLDEGIGFDALDQKPVDLLVFLLVSGDANQTHLDTLAGLAKMLSVEENRAALRKANSGEELRTTLLNGVGLI